MHSYALHFRTFATSVSQKKSREILMSFHMHTVANTDTTTSRYPTINVISTALHEHQCTTVWLLLLFKTVLFSRAASELKRRYINLRNE